VNISAGSGFSKNNLGEAWLHRKGMSQDFFGGSIISDIR
jgi:hypothetical protein